jgi:hypothetical protein
MAPPISVLASGITPALVAEEAIPAVKTLYLGIDLKNGASPTTAVFIPTDMAAQSPVDILLYLHGHKSSLNGVTLAGMSIQKYLTVKEFNLRQFVLSASSRNFVLVVPTLNDTSGAGLLTAAATNFDAFLDQVLAGIDAHFLTPAGRPGKPVLRNIVLAAHSGGGAAMLTIATNATAGTNNKICEVWGFDCTYGGGGGWLKWIQSPAHSLHRLWLYSTGSFFRKGIDPAKPISKTNPADPASGRTGTGDDTHILAAAAAAGAQSQKLKNVQISIANTGERVNWTYPTGSVGHNETVGTFFTLLVNSSTNLP